MDENLNISYVAVKVVGYGAFGVVQQAKVVNQTSNDPESDANDKVAIKKVLQDKRYKNRELQILKDLRHSNVISLKHAFQTSGAKPEELYLNLVMDQMPFNLVKLMKDQVKKKELLPMELVKLYSFQMLKALNQLHQRDICHRDIKPQNFLIDEKHTVKLCDFGSAKLLAKNESNVSYICSRQQRAPELIFGATEYSDKIDVWSLGCVIAEMLLGQPLFPGESSVDQMVEIVKILGSPSKEEIREMNPTQNDQKFPDIRPLTFNRVFREDTSKDAQDLVKKMIVYSPKDRLTALDLLSHEFFTQLKDSNFKLPDGTDCPNSIFEFSNLEIPDVANRNRILPDWVRDNRAKF